MSKNEIKKVVSKNFFEKVPKVPKVPIKLRIERNEDFPTVSLLYYTVENIRTLINAKFECPRPIPTATICIDQLVLNAVKMSRKGGTFRFPHTPSVSRNA